MSKSKSTTHRAAGNGTLVKRGKFYHARWMMNGKLYVKSTGCSNLRDAEKKLAEFTAPFKTKSEVDALAVIKKRLEDAEIAQVAKDKQTQVKFLLDIHKSDVDVSEISAGTENIYGSMLSQFEKWAKSNHDVTFSCKVTKKIAEEYLTSLKERLQARSYNQHLKLLKMVFDTAMKHDNNIKANPFAEFKLLKVNASFTRREFTEEEFTKIHEATSKLTLEGRLLFALGEYAGMRVSDAACCKWSSVKFNEKKLKYTPIKTQRTGIVAVVPIHNKLMSLLKERRKAAPKEDEFVIPSIEELYANKNLGNFVRRVFKDANLSTCKKNEITHKLNIETGFHALRHSFASRCVREGIPITQVQMMLGHSTPLMSMEYAHAKEKDLYLPEFDENLTTVKIKKSTYAKLIELQRENESFEDCVDRLIRTGMIDFDEIKRREAERKAKEDKELDDMIDEVFGLKK